jgi:hypothetical protein
MTKDATELTQQNSERAMQVANLGMNWARELAEQNLRAKSFLTGYLKSPARWPKSLTTKRRLFGSTLPH